MYEDNYKQLLRSVTKNKTAQLSDYDFDIIKVLDEQLQLLEEENQRLFIEQKFGLKDGKYKRLKDIELKPTMKHPSTKYSASYLATMQKDAIRALNHGLKKVISKNTHDNELERAFCERTCKVLRSMGVNNLHEFKREYQKNNNFVQEFEDNSGWSAPLDFYEYRRNHVLTNNQPLDRDVLSTRAFNVVRR
jgi:hypothetical protein